MSYDDYLIDHRGLDWQMLLSEWTWLVPSEFSVWFMNRYGDLFLELSDSSVHMLDVGGGTLEMVADSRADFEAKFRVDDNANEWLMIPLVDQVVAAGMTLQKGECYSYKQPPVLGGKYTVENTSILPIAEHFAFYGSIYNQIKDVPGGSHVILVPTDGVSEPTVPID